MADETSKKVQEYKNSLKTKGELLILKGFPESIVKLNHILETHEFLNRVDIHQDLNIPIPDSIVINNHISSSPPTKKCKFDNNICQDGTTVMVLPSGDVRCNKNLSELVDIVKPHIRKLVEDSNFLKMWISVMIPKIEDGDNFGVSIQKEALTKVQYVESEASEYYERITRYFTYRSKLASKVAKYPHIEDCRRAVQEFDEKAHLTLWLVMAEIRNHYCFLHDIVVKNLDKIKKPRSSNAHQSLY